MSMQQPISINLVIKAESPDTAERIVRERMEKILNAWIAEDFGKLNVSDTSKPPGYPIGSLLTWNIQQ